MTFLDYSGTFVVSLAHWLDVNVAFDISCVLFSIMLMVNCGVPNIAHF